MASSSEEFDDFIVSEIKKNHPALLNLGDAIEKKFNFPLSDSDISYVEEKFVKISLRIWEDECREIISAQVNQQPIDCSELVALSNEFNDFTEFDKIPKFLQNASYKSIINERGLFDELVLAGSCSSLRQFFDYKIKEVQSGVDDEVQFIEEFLEVIRAADLQFEELINTIKLADYANRLIPLKKVLQLIVDNDFVITSYEKLREHSKALLSNPIVVLKEQIHSEIKKIALPLIKKVFEENGKKIYRIEGKILFWADFVNFTENFDEVQIFCDVLHFNGSEASYKFNIDNLIIVANMIKIYDCKTIDLSGKNG